MLKGLYTAYTGMLNEQHRMDTITNNLANVSTNGFKKEGATSQSFDTVLAYKIKDSTDGSFPKRLGGMNMGVKIGENYVNYDQGGMKETGNQFDLALSGDGFFEIEYTNKAGETSVKYTRDGNFTLDNQGYLRTQDGDYVLNDRGRHIRLNTALDVSIDKAGIIYQDGAEVATIGITDFEDYDYLQRYGENLFDAVEGAEEKEPENLLVRAGYLELSNVSIVSEMVDMIAIQRQYESNQKVITTYDSSLDIAANQLGKI